MAETIRGIQVKIEGDTKSLGKALDSVNSNLKDTQKLLNTVNKSLELDPTNTSLLAEKQKLLAQQIENTSKKLKTLKNAQGQVEEQYKNGKIGTDAYIDFQKELVNTQNQFDKLSNQSINANQKIENSTEKAASAIRRTTSSIKDNSIETDINSNKQEKNSKTTDTLKKAFEGLGKVSLKALSNSIDGVGIALKGISTASIKAITETVEISTKAFEGYTTAIVGSLTATNGLAISPGMEFTSQMSTVQALAGYTDGSQEAIQSMELLEEKAKEVGASTSFSAAQVGEAFEYMAMAGWGKDINKMLAGIKPIVNLTSATGAELATVSDIVTDAMSSFGTEITTENVEHFADVLATVTTSANTDVTMLGEAFKSVAPMANSLSYSVDDVAMALGIMANSGIKGEQAGNALKTSLSRLASPTADMVTVMNRLNISLQDGDGNTLSFADMLNNLRTGLKGVSAELVDADGNLKEYEELEEELAGNNEQLQLISDASTLFGKNQVASMLTLINATDEEFASLKNSIDDCKGSAEAMAQVKLDNLSGDITIFKSGLEGVGLSIFDYLEAPLRDVVQSTTTLMSNLNESISNGFKWDSIISNITTFRTDLVNQFNNLFPEILNGFSGYTSAFNSIIENLVAGIIDTFPKAIGQGLPIAVTSFYDLINNIINKVTNSAPELVSSAENVINSFTVGLISASNNIQDSLPTLTKSLSNGISNILPNILKMGGSILKTISKGIIIALPEIMNIGTELLTYLGNSLENAPDFLSNFMDGIHDGLVNGVPNLLSAISEIIDNIISTLSNEDVIMKFTGLVRMITDDLKETLKEIIPELATLFPTLLDSFIQPFLDAILDEELLITISTALVDMVSSAIDFLANNTEKIVSILMQVITAISDALIDNTDVILPAISKMIEGILLGVAKNIDKLLTSLLELIDELIKVLLSPQVLTPLLNGITELITAILFALVDNLGTITTAITDAVTSILGVLLEPENLQSLTEMVSEIITDIFLALPTILAGLGDVLLSIGNSFGNWLMDLDWGNIGRDIIKGIVDGFDRAWDYASQAIFNIGNRIVGWFNGDMEIESPSKRMKRETGQYILPGVVEGIKESIPNTITDINSSIDKITTSMDFNGITGTMSTNLSNLLIPDLSNLPNFDGYSQSISNINNNTNNSYSNSYGSLFNGANIYINNDNDVESLAEKLSFYMQQHNMGVGVA